MINSYLDLVEPVNPQDEKDADISALAKRLHDGEQVDCNPDCLPNGVALSLRHVVAICTFCDMEDKLQEYFNGEIDLYLLCEFIAAEYIDDIY